MINNVFKKVVFFDFTGTLFDPFINIRSILNSVSKEMGFKHYVGSDLETIKKMPPLALLNTFSVPDADKKAVVKEVLVRLENEIQSIPPVPGIQDMLYSLQQQNCYLGILSSNRQDNITKWLHANEIDIFHDTICIPFQENKTPHLQSIRDKFPDLNDFIFISDEAKDLVQAHEAGFSPIGVAWGFDSVTSLRQVTPRMILIEPSDFLPTQPLY